MKTHDASALAALAGDTPVAMYVQLDFQSGTQRYWTGGYDTDWNGQTWVGTGGIVSIGEIKETDQLQAVSVPLQLSGASGALVALLQSGRVRGVLCTLWFAALDAAENPIGTIPVEFRGKLDEPAIAIAIGDPEATIQINVVSALADFARPKEARFTNEDQQARYPGDTIFDGIHETVEMEVIWPAKSWFQR